MSSGAGGLIEELIERLAAHDAPDALVDTVLAAAAGPEALAALIGGTAPARPAPAPAPAAGDPVEGVYLAALRVAGFRGIGDPVTVRFPPGPGLTVITGRNGSGKSSLAEALEVALTGTAHRFDRSQVWRQGWRNAHAPHDPEIGVDVHLPGTRGSTVLARHWSSGESDHRRSTATAQSPGGPRRPLEELGWSRALSAMRPFLSHTEVESFLDASPSELHDRLGTVLGLEPVEAAMNRIKEAQKPLADRVRSRNTQLTALKSRLAASSDARAQQAAALLRKRQPPIDELARLASGSVPDPAITELGEVARRRPVDLDAAGALIATLRQAVPGWLAADTPEARSADELVELLEAALAVCGPGDHTGDHTGTHTGTHTGDGRRDCPLCLAPAALGSAWVERTQARIAGLSAQAEARRAARAAVVSATDAVVRWARSLAVPDAPRAEARGVALGPWRDAVAAVDAALARLGTQLPGPASLTGSLTGSLTAIPPDSPTDSPTDSLTATPPDARVGAQVDAQVDALVDALDAAAIAVHDAQTAAIAAAGAELERSEAAWREIAPEVAAWVALAREVAAGEPVANRLDDAAAWFKEALVAMRNDRLDPIRSRAQELWSMLRRQSNVELTDIRFEGTNTSRRLSFDVRVDDVSQQALGVMSQGELNALALSVFLPRAAQAASPFRFVVVDDPVQAMDPSKVDGLARVLELVARDRQVIVFTHDQRLLDAVEHLRIEATVLQVERGVSSAVRVEPYRDAVARMLGDARAMLRDDAVPEPVRVAVVANLCRQAVEAALSTRYRARAIAEGRTHEAIEAELRGARGLYGIAALAVLGDASRTGDVLTDLNRRWGRVHADAFRLVNEAGHGGTAVTVRPPELVRDVEALIGQVRR